MKRTWFISAVTGMVLCGAASADPVTTWSYGASNLQYADEVINDLVGWHNYETSPNIGTSPLDNGIKIFGTGDDFRVFHLTGATYNPGSGGDPDYHGNQLVIFGGGTIDGSMWSHPDDIVRTSFGIGFGFTGGTLDIHKVETSFTLFDSEGGFVTGVGSGTSLGSFDPGGWGLGFGFEDRFGADIHTARNIAWSVTIGFDWTGMTAEDAFDFYIEPNSIDIQAMTVPEPVTMSLLTLGGLAIRRRRRQTKL